MAERGPKEILSQEQIKHLHCGLFHCPFLMALELMPTLKNVLMNCPLESNMDLYTVDIKVHMLMPGQYPCIPNWHYDLVPRDENKKQLFEKVNLKKSMYLWVSGEPLTEFKKTGLIPSQKWVVFNQMDEHRGTVSKNHVWRVFIRVAPIEFLPATQNHKWFRRHSQVYLDAEKFKW